MKRWNTRALLGLLLLAGAAQPALACRFLPQRLSAQEQVARAGDVSLVKVVRATPRPGPAPDRPRDTPAWMLPYLGWNPATGHSGHANRDDERYLAQYPVEYEFVVEKRWRGADRATFTLMGVSPPTTFHDPGPEANQGREEFWEAGGGRYARMLATRHPESVKTVVILSSGGKYEDKDRFAIWLGAVMKTLKGEITPPEMDAAMLASGAFAAGNDPSPWRTGWWPVATAQAKGGENVKAEEYSKAGGRPMLAIYGKEDGIAPPQNSLALKDELGDQVTVMGLDRAAHNMLQEQPVAITDAIDNWIKAALPR